MKENVIQNINSAINSIRRSRQKNVLVVRREIHMVVVSSITKDNRLVKSMARALGTLRKNLHKHRKFRLQIDVNDELACWRAICRQPYKDRLGKNVKKNNIWILEEKFTCFAKWKGCDAKKNSMKSIRRTSKTFLGHHSDRVFQQVQRK